MKSIQICRRHYQCDIKLSIYSLLEIERSLKKLQSLRKQPYTFLSEFTVNSLVAMVAMQGIPDVFLTHCF